MLIFLARDRVDSLLKEYQQETRLQKHDAQQVQEWFYNSCASRFLQQDHDTIGKALEDLRTCFEKMDKKGSCAWREKFDTMKYELSCRLSIHRLTYNIIFHYMNSWSLEHPAFPFPVRCWDEDVKLVFAHVFLNCDSDAGVLLVQDSKTKKWMLPGGGVELNESADDAIKREFCEEAGDIGRGGQFHRMFTKCAMRKGGHARHAPSHLQVYDLTWKNGGKTSWKKLLQDFAMRTHKNETSNVGFAHKNNQTWMVTFTTQDNLQSKNAAEATLRGGTQEILQAVYDRQRQWGQRH